MSFRTASNVNVTAKKRAEVLKFGMTNVAKDNFLETGTFATSHYRTVQIPCSNLKSKHAGMQDMASLDGVGSWLKNVPVGQWMTICNDELVALKIVEVSSGKFYSLPLKTFGLVSQVVEIPKYFSAAWDYNEQVRELYARQSDVFYMARFEKSTDVMPKDDKWNVTFRSG